MTTLCAYGSSQDKVPDKCSTWNKINVCVCGGGGGGGGSGGGGTEAPNRLFME